MINIKTEKEIELLRESNRIVALCFKKLKKLIKPGITTGRIEDICVKIILDNKGLPAFKGYLGYPGSICVSINQEIVHGIPNHRRKISQGDIVSVDVGVVKNGYYGDAARSYIVGKPSDSISQKLVDVTHNALKKGISQAVPGNRLSDIGAAIERYVSKHGFSPVRDFVGHGIGKKLHEDPQIPNYGKPGQGPSLKKGMVFAIEPMINQGTYKIKILSDRWTAVTADNKLSAHFEDTIVIRNGNPEILSRV